MRLGDSPIKDRVLPKILIVVGCALLCVLATISLCVGSGSAGFATLLDYVLGRPISDTDVLILEQLRMPRVIIGIIAGASLALAGAGMQSLFRNPLADPSITGVSAGAALGAVLAISYFSSTNSAIQIGAISCGLLATCAICLLGRSNGRMSTVSILLAGIAINAFCGAIVGYCMYAVRDAGLRGFVFWTLGSLDRCDWTNVKTAIAICAPSALALYAMCGALNVMLLGREQAYHSGINTTFVWTITIVSSAIMTAVCVAICGTIGFVGLVVPHICRIISSPDNRTLLPLSAIAGACLMTVADILSRQLSPADPVPIGVITALIGAPIFVILLKKNGGDSDA